MSERPYRVLVTGSRDWADWGTVRRALDEVYALAPRDREFTVVHGACPTGADEFARWWAEATDVTEEPHPAQWATHGRAAGPIRNAHMVTAGADVCLAFIRNGSRGATHTARLAEDAGIPVRRWTA